MKKNATVIAGFLIVIFLALSMWKELFPEGDLSGEEASIAVDQITIQKLDERTSEEGIEYSFLIANGSDYTVREMSVGFSYPIKTNNGTKSNKDQIKSTDGLDVFKPGAELTIIIFVPEAYYSGRNYDMEEPEIQIEGYLNSVKELNKFGKWGSLEAFF